jgi:aryl carrier-like protein
MTDVIATTEATLCRILAEVLGVDLVHPEDGFFEVGGDSVLALQVVARAREAGLALIVRDLFDHQSPRALAAVTGALPDSANASGAAVAAEPPPGMLLSDEFEDTDLDDFEDTALSQQVGDAGLGWEALT